jgi:UDP-N-acetylmuramoylalanine--D-glutamate ligase
VASFDHSVILILGGRDKGASYDPLIQAMQGKVKHVLLIGEASGKIAAAIDNRFPVTQVSSLEDAVREGAKLGEQGDIVLLSPACASFDMFDNYEHRGRVFKKAVQELPQ